VAIIIKDSKISAVRKQGRGLKRRDSGREVWRKEGEGKGREGKGREGKGRERGEKYKYSFAHQVIRL
jgi:hypothetical protein